jgi:uncharacterized protein
LLQAGADHSAATNSGDTPLIVATGKNHQGVVRLLLDAGAAADAANNYGNTPLNIAASRGY